jgi:hypothetical protein
MKSLYVPYFRKTILKYKSLCKGIVVMGKLSDDVIGSELWYGITFRKTGGKQAYERNTYQ